jgi:nucleosome binding factor SPN SPT16 subunit
MTDYETTFQGLPSDPKKRATILAYLKEALQHKEAQDLAKTKEDEVYAAIKNSEDNLEITQKYFKDLVAFVYEKEKKMKVLKKLEAAKEGSELLGLVKAEESGSLFD